MKPDMKIRGYYFILTLVFILCLVVIIAACFVSPLLFLYALVALFRPVKKVEQKKSNPINALRKFSAVVNFPKHEKEN